jgi:O-methyltransferase
MLFRKLFSRNTAVPAGAVVEFPLEVEEKLAKLHSRSPMRQHLDILYGDVRVGGESFVDVYFRCLEHTGTAVTPFNIFQRFQTRCDLLRYFMATLTVPGARAECGAYRGATALLLSHAWRGAATAFRGAGLHLIDSFSGTEESSEHDLIPVRDPGGPVRLEPFFPARSSDVTPGLVRGLFGEFPEVAIHAGWIPEVLSSIDQKCWAFVHIDLTLYRATFAALEYFYPRLSPGGVIFCDGSLFCPGVEKAVDRYCAAHALPCVVLRHRQFVLMK